MADLTGFGPLTGYRRPNGSFGIRNKVLVLSITGLTGQAARAIGLSVPGTHVIATPYGTGLIAEDRKAQMRCLEGLSCNPNVASVLLISDHVPKLKTLSDAIAGKGQIVEPLSLDDEGQDQDRLIARGVELASAMVEQAKRTKRSTGSWADLRIGLKCGRSDPSSGLVANPAVGRVVDRLIDAGGTAIFGEVVEWLGAEHLIADRAVDKATAERLQALPRAREARAVAAGIDLLGNNPSPTNIASGLSTIEEKSLGGISKTGTRPIRGLLDYGEVPPGPGLFAMDTPNYAPEHLTALSAAGCQLHLFTTGAGNPFVSGLCPTLKISANPDTCGRLPHQIDVPLSNTLLSAQSEEDAETAILRSIAEVVNDNTTFGEVAGCGDDVISRFAAAL